MIREKLKAAALKRGFSPWGISKGTGVRFESLRDFLNGKRDNIGIKNLEKLMTYFCLDIIENEIINDLNEKDDEER